MRPPVVFFSLRYVIAVVHLFILVLLNHKKIHKGQYNKDLTNILILQARSLTQSTNSGQQ